ncbi:MAG: hypothetical protein GY950_31835 [bacterium]|nr:hypothetical protein [bacterium]
MKEETKTSEVTGGQAPVAGDQVPAVGGQAPAAGDQTPPANGNDDGTKKKKTIIRTFEKKLLIIRTAIVNAQKPGLFHDYIAEYGYDDTRLNECVTLLSNTETARTDQKNAIALKLQKTRESTQKKTAAEDIYTHHLVIGREEFKDDPHMFDKLGFNGIRKKDFGGWKAQTMLLYENIGTPGVVEGYAKHSITQEALEGAKQAVLDAEQAIADRIEAKAEAEKATEKKNKIFRQLLSWWQKFIKVVHVALEEDPQLKEQVNIVAPSFR